MFRCLSKRLAVGPSQEWLFLRKRHLPTGPAAYGLPGPRGLLLMGVQGCGKSSGQGCSPPLAVASRAPRTSRRSSGLASGGDVCGALRARKPWAGGVCGSMRLKRDLTQVARDLRQVTRRYGDLVAGKDPRGVRGGYGQPRQSSLQSYPAGRSTRYFSWTFLIFMSGRRYCAFICKRVASPRLYERGSGRKTREIHRNELEHWSFALTSLFPSEDY